MNFPSPLSPHLEDGGEGGDENDACCVDVSIQLTEPDVLLNPGRVADVWGDGLSGTAYPERTSLPPRAAVFLDSTSASLWDERVGNYWCARPDDLTGEGKILYDMLRRVNGVEPLLLTLLDT